MIIQFETGEQYQRSRGYRGSALFTPLFMLRGKSKYFVMNIVEEISGDSPAWIKLHNEQNAAKIEKAKNQLMENGGQYLTFHGLQTNPFDFLNWVKEKGYTLEVHGELFYESTQKSARPFTDFHGNVLEYSAAFMYRVYDKKVLSSLREITAAIPQHYHYRREEVSP